MTDPVIHTGDTICVCLSEPGEEHARDCPRLAPHPSAPGAARERETLESRLRAIVEYKAAWKRDPSGQFETIAEQFYRETGLLAPGKSVPPAMGNQDESQRRQQWDAFTARLSDERDATILEAADALAARPAVPVGQAFKAGYHCRWHREVGAYCFDPAMSPGDPDGAYAAWLASRPTGRWWGIPPAAAQEPQL